jgi:hypothetical protein
MYEIADGLSLCEAYESIHPVLPIEFARFSIDDKQMEDISFVPAEDSTVCIKVLPASDTEGWKKGGFWTSMAGVAVMVLGLGLLFVPGGGLFTPALLKIGAGIFITGWSITATAQVALNSLASEDKRQDLYGSSGSTARWSPIPLVYGTHYLAPTLVSSDWTDLTDVDDSPETVLHQLYALGDQNTSWGTKTIVDSISIGDNALYASREMSISGRITRTSDTRAVITMISSNTSTIADIAEFMEKEVDGVDYSFITGSDLTVEGHIRPQMNRAFKVDSWSSDAITIIHTGTLPFDDTVCTLTLKHLYFSSIYEGVTIKVIEDGVFTGTPYPRVVYESYIGTELSSEDTFHTYFTTPDNVKGVTAVISCPSGLYALSGQTKSKASVEVEIKAKRVGTESWADAYTVSIDDQKTTEACRKSIDITFATPGQWLLGFKKLTTDLDSDDGVNTTNIERVTSVRTRRVQYQGEFASAPSSPLTDWIYTNTTDGIVYVYTGSAWEVYVDADFDMPPVHDDIKTSFSYLAMQIIASDQLNGSISDLNCILRHELYAYDAVTETWVPSFTDNPASVFVDTLLNPVRNRYPIYTGDVWNNLASVPIDWPAIVEWYTYCETEGFGCNGVLSESTTVKDELDKIVYTGRASFTIKDGKYSVVIDRERDIPVQLFTPRNTHGFSATRTFVERPDGVRVQFTNKDAGYQSDELRVDFADSAYNTYDELSLTYITDSVQALNYAKYYLNVQNVRQETFTFSTDFEYLVCTAGDRIKFQHDVPLFGMLAARVSAVEISGGYIASIIVDETVDMEAGFSYAIDIRVRNETGDGFSLLTLTVLNTEETTNRLTFETPQALGLIERGDLLAFGKANLVTEDLIISEINCGDDLSASITCTKYDEAVYDLSSFADWQSNVGHPASQKRSAYVEDATSRSITNLYTTIEEGRGNKIFYDAQPVPPYRIGDMWSSGISVYVCTVSRIEGESFVAEDWQLTATETFQTVSIEQFQHDNPEHRWFMSPSAEYPILQVHGFTVNSEVGTNVKENVLEDDSTYWEALAAVGVLTVPDTVGTERFRVVKVEAKTADGQTSYIAGRWGLDAWHGQAFINLIASPNAPATQDIVLDSGNYVLQTYQGTVACSYGSAIYNTPLIFTATAGSTTFTMTGAKYVSLTKTAFVPPYVVGIYTANYNSYAITVPTVSGIAVVHNRPVSYSNIMQLYVDANNYILMGIIGSVLRVIRRGGGVELVHDYDIDEYIQGEDLPFSLVYDHDTYSIDLTFGDTAIETLETWAYGTTVGADQLVHGFVDGATTYVYGHGIILESSPATLYVGAMQDVSAFFNNQIHMVSY